MEINVITGQIIDAAMKVHSELGPGLLESAYEACLLHELHKRSLCVGKQVPLPIEYDGDYLDVEYRIDLLVEDLVIVELKAVDKLLPIFEAQLLSYLKLSKLHVGLLINFNVTRLKDGIKRVVNDYRGRKPSDTLINRASLVEPRVQIDRDPPRSPRPPR